MIFNLIKKISHLRLLTYKNFFLKILKKNKITFIDIGASIQIIPRWKKIDKKNLKYVLFEPNKLEVEKLKLNKRYYEDYKIYDSGLGSSNKKETLNVTRGIYQSSILKPNFGIIKQFPNNERFEIIKKISINTKKLDSFKITNPDFIKIDTQGFNFEILKGSKKTLQYALGLEIEVEFNEIYKKQKLFGDTDKFLKKNNFIFIDFLSLVKWKKTKLVGGQCFFGNALYLKKIDSIKKINKNILLKYISICLLYNKFDIAEEIIKKYNLSDVDKNFIIKKIKFLEKKSSRSNFIKKISNAIIKLLDIDQGLYLFK